MTIKIMGYSRAIPTDPPVTYQPVEFPEEFGPTLLAIIQRENPSRIWHIEEVTGADRKRRAKARRHSKSVRKKRRNGTV